MAAAAVRCALLLSRPLWHDELFTVWVSRLPASELIRALRHDSGPPLFYSLEKPLVFLAEALHHDEVVRLLPFAAALLLFGAAAWLPGEPVPAVFILLTASSPLLLFYSAEARAYAVLALFSLALFLLLFHGDNPASRKRLASAAVAATLALWTHYLAIFLVAACALLLLLRKRLAPIAALTVAALLFLPWTPILAVQPATATSWMREPLGGSIVGFFASLGGSGRIPNPLGGPLPIWLVASGALLGAALLAAVIAASRRDRQTADGAILVVVTMSLALLVSLVRPVAFPGRSEMVILPIWIWTVAQASARNRPVRWLAAASAAVALLASVLLVSRPIEQPLPRGAVATVARLATDGDAVIAAAAFYLPARLAHDRGELRATLTAFPSDLAEHPGWIAAEPPSEKDYRDLEATLSRLASGQRAFLLLHPLFRTPELDRLLQRHGAVRALLQRPDALLLLLTAR